MRNLSLITVLLLLFAACGTSDTNNEEPPHELEQESTNQRNNEQDETGDTEMTSEDGVAVDNVAETKRSSPQKVDFGVDMLTDLTLYGEKSVIRLTQNNATTYSLADGSKQWSMSYDGSSLADAVTVFPDKEALIIKIHQAHAIGGIIGIEKISCKRGSYQTGFQYSFKVTWENESDRNDAGCAFHSAEEYQIIASVQSMGAGTGGTIFSFEDREGNEYNFYNGSNGVNLMEHFPELSPMNNDNPYKNKEYKLFYKFVEVEDHRGFRVEPIVTYIEEV